MKGPPFSHRKFPNLRQEDRNQGYAVFDYFNVNQELSNEKPMMN